MTFLRQFYAILLGRRLLVALSVLCGLLFAAANLLPPLVIRQLILWLTEGGGSSTGLLQLVAMLFGVYLIPHTLEVTTLGLRQPGARVNLETDLIGKYVVRTLVARGDAPPGAGSGISEDFLKDHGYL